MSPGTEELIDRIQPERVSETLDVPYQGQGQVTKGQHKLLVQLSMCCT